MLISSFIKLSAVSTPTTWYTYTYDKRTCCPMSASSLAKSLFNECFLTTCIDLHIKRDQPKYHSIFFITMKLSLSAALSAQLCVGAFSFSAKNEGSRPQQNTLDTERRNLFKLVPAALLASQPAFLLGSEPAFAASDGNLDDLPPDSKKSYLQYRIPLQIAADYYIFDLQDKIGDINEWGNIGEMFQMNSARGGQGQPSKIERDFINPMRIMSLSMPPDVSDEMRETQFQFEAAMAKISKATAGFRRDLPVEIPRENVDAAKQGWEEGRLAYNQFFALLNGTVGLSELKLVPAPGPNQRTEYGRSGRRYNELIKKTKLCQNRGGPALSQGWGLLMVSGYLQDSCGIPDLETYFFQ
jgi:hypothetical protein